MAPALSPSSPPMRELPCRPPASSVALPLALDECSDGAHAVGGLYAAAVCLILLRNIYVDAYAVRGNLTMADIATVCAVHIACGNIASQADDCEQLVKASDKWPEVRFSDDQIANLLELYSVDVRTGDGPVAIPPRGDPGRREIEKLVDDLIKDQMHQKDLKVRELATCSCGVDSSSRGPYCRKPKRWLCRKRAQRLYSLIVHYFAT